MKVAITAKGSDMSSEVDPRFGRAAYILIVETENMSFEVCDNSENVAAFKGAGIQAATLVAEKGAEVLLTGYCGPNAFKTATAGGIKVVNDVTGTVQEAIEMFENGSFEFSTDANVDGHW